MVSVTSYTYPTETENDNSHFQSQTQSQGLSQSLRDSIEGNIEAFDAMEQSGLLDNCRTLSKNATFREVFRSLLLYILDSYISIGMISVVNWFLIFMLRLNQRMRIIKHGSLPQAWIAI